MKRSGSYLSLRNLAIGVLGVVALLVGPWVANSQAQTYPNPRPYQGTPVPYPMNPLLPGQIPPLLATLPGANVIPPFPRAVVNNVPYPTPAQFAQIPGGINSLDRGVSSCFAYWLYTAQNRFIVALGYYRANTTMPNRNWDGIWAEIENGQFKRFHFQLLMRIDFRATDIIRIFTSVPQRAITEWRAPRTEVQQFPVWKLLSDFQYRAGRVGQWYGRTFAPHSPDVVPASIPCP